MTENTPVVVLSPRGEKIKKIATRSMLVVGIATTATAVMYVICRASSRLQLQDDVTEMLSVEGTDKK